MIATPPGGKPTLYFASNDAGSANGPVTAVAESNCATDFSVSPEPTPGSGGTWDFLSYGLDAAGQGLVFMGTADPDGAAYALNALTGAMVWRFQAYNPGPGIFDIGAGLTVSPPGANGFADGVVYFPNKAGYMYALDLATGSQLWVYSFGAQTGLLPTGSLDTAALSGTSLVFGDDGGMWSLNAVTGGRTGITPTGRAAWSTGLRRSWARSARRSWWTRTSSGTSACFRLPRARNSTRIRRVRSRPGPRH